MVPPRWLRRLVLAPAVPVATGLLLTTLPLVALVAAFASPLLPGRLRPLRLLLFLIVFLVTESVAIIALFLFWIASGFGHYLDREVWQAAHYGVMRRYLDVLVHTAQRTFKLGFDLDLEEGRRSGPEEEALHGPLIVLSRHAGPGDSFLLAHGLLRLGLRPRIVLRETLQWAPALDIGLHRLPSHFVRRGAPRGSGTAAVATLAAGLGRQGALVIFPEGRNFTPSRRLHSIAKLEELDRHAEAEEARRMRYVLTPRPGGALAAFEAARGADVIFVAHTGLEDLSSVVDLWRGLPMDSRVQVKLWRVPAGEVPHHREEGAAWLLGWWRRIDRWILERVGPEAVPDAVISAVTEEPPVEESLSEGPPADEPPAAAN